MPRWSLAAAFAAGLLPGLALYWLNRHPPAPAHLPAPLPVTAPAAPSTAPAPPKPLDEKPRNPVLPTPPDRPLSADPQTQAQLQETAAKWAAAERTVAELESKLHDVEARLTATTAQQQTAQAQERELREQMQTTQRQLAALETTLKARDTRVAELETLQQRLQRQASETGPRLQRLTEIAVELEEIARRRESYLNTIIGRYREATDLFRAISLRLDNPRDASSPLNNDLSRIQAAIQHADEDLRQLRALNAQSARLQKELTARR